MARRPVLTAVTFLLPLRLSSASWLWSILLFLYLVPCLALSDHYLVAELYLSKWPSSKVSLILLVTRLRLHRHSAPHNVNLNVKCLLQLPLHYYTDKIILITGSSRGIGRACAVQCAKHGAKGLILHYYGDQVTKDEVISLKESLGQVETITVPGDISDPATSTTLVEEAVKAFGRIGACGPNI